MFTNNEKYINGRFFDRITRAVQNNWSHVLIYNIINEKATFDWKSYLYHTYVNNNKSRNLYYITMGFEICILFDWPSNSDESFKTPKFP